MLALKVDGSCRGWGADVAIGRRTRLGALCVGLLASAAVAQPVPRQAPVSGQIVTRKSGETAVLVPSPEIRTAEVRQELKAGDVLRTNNTGTLAIVFADQTQIRLGRNSTMLVREVSAGVPSSIELTNGQLWARSPRGRSNLSIQSPSANTGIRGTSFTIGATPEQTTVQVFEGEVEFFNDLGSLSVAAGQAATALLGQAPSRIFVVEPDERKQMLHYIPLRDAYRYLQPFQGLAPAARAERTRITAVPATQRSALDWLVLAETGAEIDTRASRYDALAQARTKGLSDVADARADLVEATLALEENDLPRANTLFENAQRGLSGEQLVLARYGARITSTTPDTSQERIYSLAELAVSSQSISLAEAFMAAYRGDLLRALEIAGQGEQIYPDNVQFSVLKGNIALLLGDANILRDAVNRSLAKDRDSAAALMLSAQLKAEYEGDLAGAFSDAQRATQVAPGNALAWNVLSIVHTQRGDLSAADASYRLGIAADPKDPLLRANRAANLLDQNLLQEARAEIGAALELDPTYSISRAYLGRLYIQEGAYDKAQTELLAASVANPNYAQTLLLLAQVYHRNGEYAVAEQQLERAEAYDTFSPFPPLFRSAMALDRNNTHEAIANARLAVERFEARGGEYREAASASRISRYLTAGLRSAGLTDWARFHSDRSFNSNDPASYFDRAANGRSYPYIVDRGIAPATSCLRLCVPPTAGGGADIFLGTQTNNFSLFGGGLSPFLPYDGFTPSYEWSFSDQIRGLMLDPLSVANSTRRFRLFNERFVEGQVTTSLVGTDGNLRGGVRAQVQGLHDEAAPIAFNLVGSYVGYTRGRADQRDRELITLGSALGAEITPSTRLVVVGTYDSLDRQIPVSISSSKTQNWNLLAFLNQDFGRHVRLQFGGGLSEAEADLNAAFSSVPLPPAPGDEAPEFPIGDLAIRNLGKTKRQYATASLQFEALRTVSTIGAEYLNLAETAFSTIAFRSQTIAIEETEAGLAPKLSQERYFANVRNSFVPWLTVEGYFTAAPYPYTVNEDSPEPPPPPPIVSFSLEGSPTNTRTEWRFEYGAGASVDLSERTTIRGAYFNSIQDWFSYTLAPSSAVGLFPNDAPTVVGDFRPPANSAPPPSVLGSHSVTYVGRIDHEWSDRVFTAIEFQHQTHDELRAPVLDTLELSLGFDRDSFSVAPAFVHVGAGSIDRLSATMNVLVGSKVALNLGYAYSASSCKPFRDEPTEPIPVDPPFEPISDDPYGGLPFPGEIGSCKHSFLPEHAARVQAVWDMSSQWRVELGASYVGPRQGGFVVGSPSPGDVDSVELKAFTTVNGSARWRSQDKAWEAQISVFNLFDADIRTYPLTPAYGRTLVGSLTLRF